jgi:hypothetical protein
VIINIDGVKATVDLVDIDEFARCAYREHSQTEPPTRSCCSCFRRVAS